MKKYILHGLISIEAIFLFSLWLIFTFNFRLAQDLFDVEASAKSGINIVKSQIGGCYLVFVFLVILYFVQRKADYLKAAAVAVMAVLITRVLSIIADGISSYALVALCNEIIILVLIVLTTGFSYNSTSKSQK